MSTATGGAGGDPPQTPGSYGPSHTSGSQGPKKSRGPTTGSTSAKATHGVPGAKVVTWDPINQTFHQDSRRTNSKIGLLSSRLGALVKAHVPPTTHDWAEVSPQTISAILSALHSEFTFVYTDHETGEVLPADCYRNTIDQTIIRNAKIRRRNQKSKLSSKYRLDFSGRTDLAKNETPTGYNKEDWEAVVDEFGTDEWKKKSERNKANSSKKKTRSTQGSLSFFAHRHMNSKEDGTLGSALDTWEKKHHNKKGEWTTDWARQAHARIVSQMADLQRQAEERGAIYNIDDAEEYAMQEVLGQRQDWYVGIGPMVPRSSWAVAQAQDESSSSGSSSRRFPDPAVIELQTQLAAQQAAMDEMRRSSQAQIEEMQRQIFAFSQQFSPMPNMSSGPSMPQMSPMSPMMPQHHTPPSVPMADTQTTPPASAEFQRDRTTSGNNTRGSSSSGGGRFRGRGGSAIKEWFTNRGKKGKDKE